MFVCVDRINIFHGLLSTFSRLRLQLSHEPSYRSCPFIIATANHAGVVGRLLALLKED